MDKYLNKITCADCLDVMRELPDKCIDLVLTDPPYGEGVGYKLGRHGKQILNNDDEGINYLVLPILYEKLKEGGGSISVY